LKEKSFSIFRVLGIGLILPLLVIVCLLIGIYLGKLVSTMYMMILGLLGAILGLITGTIITVKLFEKLSLNGG